MSKHVQRLIFNEWVHAYYISANQVEITLPEWSGRLTREGAISELEKLEAFIVATKAMLSEETENNE